MGLDYIIQYKSGSENLVIADALSRVSGAEVLCLALSVIDSNLQQLIQHSYELDINFQHLLQDLQNGVDLPPFTLKDGLIRRKKKLFIGPDDNLKNSILQWLHSSGMGGHSRRDATLKRVKSLFY